MDSDDRIEEIGCEVSDRDEHENGLRINPKHIEGPGNGNGNAWSSSFLMRSASISTSTSTLSTPRSRQGSPRSPSPTTFSSSPFRDIAPLKTAFQSRLSNAYSFSSSSSASPKHQVKKGWANFLYETKKSRLQSPKAELQESAASTTRRRQRRRRVRGVIFIVLGLLAAFFLLDWWVLSRLQDDHHQPHHLLLHEDPQFPDKSRRLQVCNAVAIARLLNATLVLPKFLCSTVWKDSSQFGDIYQEEYFINYLKADVNIVKELPLELQSLDIEAIGSLVTDMDISKESKPSFFLANILPLLLRNRVVHFLGFGNRLTFDPIPFELQRLRCKCNFHALKFIPKIQKTGALLIQRMREHSKKRGPLDEHLIGETLPYLEEGTEISHSSSKYLALHLRFEIDMAAYSMCEFGGGEAERRELQAYREIHFPTLIIHKKSYQ